MPQVPKSYVLAEIILKPTGLDKQFFSVKLEIFSYPSILAYVVVAH